MSQELVPTPFARELTLLEDVLFSLKGNVFLLGAFDSIEDCRAHRALWGMRNITFFYL